MKEKLIDGQDTLKNKEHITIETRL